MLKRFYNRRLSTKIIAMFTLVTLLTSALMFVFFSVEQDRVRYAEFDRIAKQNTQLIANNVESMLSNASYATKMAINNIIVQNVLIERRSFTMPAVMQSLRTLLNGIVNFQPYTAGVYIFNTRAQYFGMDNYTSCTFPYRSMEDAPWYDEVAKGRGYYVMTLNAGEKETLYGSENIISMIRLIYNLDKQSEIIGAVMLNLRESYFLSSFKSFESKYHAEVMIIDDDGRSLFTRPAPYYSALSDEQRDILLSAGGSVVSLTAQSPRHISYSSVMLDGTRWHVIVALPYSGNVTVNADLSRIFALLLAAELLLVFAGTITIARAVTKPIYKLTNAMCLNESKQKPAKVDMECADDEIGMLKDTYNGMVDRIDILIRRIEDEGERKRQAEFHALQAQINPHFLYNTIDTARGLALMGRASDVNRLLRDLGEFYRNAINNGRNVITLREEVQMVKSYMDIQHIRYPDIRTVYDVNDEACGVRIPKRVLQPLVENALYHGLRPRGNRGVIPIRVWQEAERIGVSVSDDGVGIDPQTAEAALRGSGELQHSFGLRGTVDRLRLFYRREDVFSVESAKDGGTIMTIMIPNGRGMSE